MKKLIIACAALTASAGLAQETATDTGATAATEQTAEASAKDPNERICRNVEQTSTRLGRMRECKTRAAWEAQDRRNRDQAQARTGN